jgi:hypothetical protein
MFFYELHYYRRVLFFKIRKVVHNPKIPFSGGVVSR